MNKWDKYFLQQTPHIASLSPDKSTKCGAILVKDNKVIGQGFNGNAKKIRDLEVPDSRPEKYFFKIHSEVNAILNATQPIDNSCVMYVTGLPCSQCIQLMYHVGIRTVYYSNFNDPKMCDEQDKEMREWFLSLCLEPYNLIFIDRAKLEER